MLILVSLTRHATSFLLCCRRPQSISALLFVHLAIGHHMHDGAQARVAAMYIDQPMFMMSSDKVVHRLKQTSKHCWLVAAADLLREKSTAG